MKARTLSSGQLDLFCRALPDLRPGGLAFDAELRQALSRALKDCPESRYEVAAKMSELLGDEVSKNMLDAYTAESREGHQISVLRFIALIAATNAYELLDIVAGKLGCRVLRGDEVVAAELGSIDREIADLKARKTILLKQRRRR